MAKPTEPDKPPEPGRAALAALPESDSAVALVNEELRVARQALEENGCVAERVGQDPATGEILIEVKDCPEPKPFYALWFLHTLFRAGNYRVNWTVSNTKVEASMGRITNRMERARNYADRAVDLLDATGNTPATVNRQVLSLETREACGKIAEKVRRDAGANSPLANLFDSVASGRPANENPVGLNLAAVQLMKLKPTARQALNVGALRGLNKAADPKDRFFWRTIVYATLPLAP
ncbi:hypothetical protein ACFQ36_10925 [Arthrobacter sp. GCM10027362]|uniref:hypothetical protein n=1 Tax=Arthrobacter sp. GCM10027362 TaxID=3273379 RepID=UPI003639FADC